ncbi:MAG: tyrosine-type recombinase/integrase [Armatimonadetes bacterium]|nr:tyrosine-type recombinase/integrase [Armatimonadota bacterium]
MATRRANGDGSCRRITEGRFTGKWRVQLTITDSNGSKRRISRLFSTQAEGKAFMREVQRDVHRSEAEAAKPVTLTDWFFWLVENDWPDTVADSTIRSRIGRFRKYVEREWGGVPLIKIDPLDVKAFYKRLRDKGIGHATREAIKTDLVRVFNQAISPYKRVPTTWGNPFRLPMDSKPRREAVALTPMEARRALRSKGLDKRQRAFLGVMLLAGLRLGEVMALSRRQLDFERGLIHVDQAVQVSYGGRQTVGLPKGKKKRYAVMCEALAAIMQAHVADMESDQFVFSATYENQPRMRKLVYAYWRQLKKDASLPEGMRPHDCRLSHVNWIEKLCPDVSATTLKEHVGHAVSGVTEVNYTRPLSSSQRILSTEIDRILGYTQVGARCKKERVGIPALSSKRFWATPKKS